MRAGAKQGSGGEAHPQSCAPVPAGGSKTPFSARQPCFASVPRSFTERDPRGDTASDGAGTETAGASAVTVLPPAPEARRSPPEEETYLLRRLVDAAADSNRRSLQIE